MPRSHVEPILQRSFGGALRAATVYESDLLTNSIQYDAVRDLFILMLVTDSTRQRGRRIMTTVQIPGSADVDAVEHLVATFVSDWRSREPDRVHHRIGVMARRLGGTRVETKVIDAGTEEVTD